MLNHVQKLVLIPLEEWEKIRDKNMREIKQVAVSLPVPKKVNISLMNQKMNQKMKEKKDQDQKGGGKTHQNQKVSMKKMLENLSPLKKNRALSLLRYIKKSKIISWNSQFELKLKDKVVPKSNIYMLINHAVEKKSSKPVGMKMFYEALFQLDIPKFIIVNKVGHKIIKKIKNNRNILWRPPGKLDKS